MKSGRIGEVQSVVLDKSEFPTRGKAESWAKEHGFDISTSRETENTWRIRQYPPEECDGHYINKELQNGVAAVLCVSNGHLQTARGRFFQARKPAAVKQRPGGGSWEEATNRQQRKIVKVYDAWAANLKRELRRRYGQGATTPELSSFLDSQIKRLTTRLVEITSKGVEGAVKISARSRADRPEIQGLKERLLGENKILVEQNLVPRIHERLTLALATGALAMPFGMNEAVNATRAMPAGYAGGYWVAIFEVQKEVGGMRERERIAQGLTAEPVRWVLDPNAEHCNESEGFYGCISLAGEYPGGWASLKTIPAGQVTCRGNCRCHIEIFRDGEWKRGVYDD